MLLPNISILRAKPYLNPRILTECELVIPLQEGREIYYQLEVEKMKHIDVWLDQFRKIWEHRFDEIDKILITMKAKK